MVSPEEESRIINIETESGNSLKTHNGNPTVQMVPRMIFRRSLSWPESDWNRLSDGSE